MIPRQHFVFYSVNFTQIQNLIVFACYLDLTKSGYKLAIDINLLNQQYILATTGKLYYGYIYKWHLILSIHHQDKSKYDDTIPAKYVLCSYGLKR